MCPAIKMCVEEPSVSLEELINMVEDIVSQAHITYIAKPRFLANLRECQSKLEVQQLCGRAVSNGMFFGEKRTSPART